MHIEQPGVENPSLLLCEKRQLHHRYLQAFIPVLDKRGDLI